MFTGLVVPVTTASSPVPSIIRMSPALPEAGAKLVSGASL